MASTRIDIGFAAKITLRRAAVAVGVGAAALSCSASHAQDSPILVAVVKAGHACFASSVRFTGLVVPRAEAVVNFNLQGYQISEVQAKEGILVSAGQTLARLTRLGGSGPAGGPDQAAGATPRQPATLALTAPTAGLVSSSTAKIGAVAPAMPLPPPMGPGPLFRIIVDNKLEVEADVPSIDLPKLKAKQFARIRLDNGRDLSGAVRTISPEIDRNSQLGKVRLRIDDEPGIRAGMFASGTIDVSHHSCGVSIPRSSVQYQTKGTTVQVVRDNTVETRRVRLGFYSDDAIEVLDGIKEGELVVANTGAALHDGDQVKPAPVVSETSGQTGAQ